MPQTFCAFSGVPDPLDLPEAGAGALTAHTLADTGLIWQDGTPGTIPGGTQAISAYGGTSFDNAADVYYLLAVKGSGVPVLVKERDIPTVDSLLGAVGWAKWRRIVNGVDYPTPQP